MKLNGSEWRWRDNYSEFCFIQLVCSFIVFVITSFQRFCQYPIKYEQNRNALSALKESPRTNVYILQIVMYFTMKSILHNELMYLPHKHRDRERVAAHVLERINDTGSEFWMKEHMHTRTVYISSAKQTIDTQVITSFFTSQSLDENITRNRYNGNKIKCTHTDADIHVVCRTMIEKMAVEVNWTKIRAL